MLHTNFANSLVNFKMSNFKIVHLVKNSYSKIFGILQTFQNRFFCLRVCRHYSRHEAYIFITWNCRNMSLIIQFFLIRLIYYKNGILLVFQKNVRFHVAIITTGIIFFRYEVRQQTVSMLST